MSRKQVPRNQLRVMQTERNTKKVAGIIAFFFFEITGEVSFVPSRPQMDVVDDKFRHVLD